MNVGIISATLPQIIPLNVIAE